MKPSRRVLVAALAAFSLVWCLAAAPAVLARPRAPLVASPSAAPRTLILVRHAEKASDDPRDPSLSDLGRERAQALAQLLARSGAKRLIASEFKRTRETLAPLAAALGVEVESVPARDLDALAKLVTDAPPGAVLVVAGHSNTLPALAAKLGAPLANVPAGAQGPALDDAEYDRLFVLTLPSADAATAPSVLELAYGRASP